MNYIILDQITCQVAVFAYRRILTAIPISDFLRQICVIIKEKYRQK